MNSRTVSILSVLLLQISLFALSIVSTVLILDEPEEVCGYIALGSGNKNFFVIMGLVSSMVTFTNIVCFLRIARNGQNITLSCSEYLLLIMNLSLGSGWVVIGVIVLSYYRNCIGGGLVNLFTGMEMFAMLIVYHALRHWFRIDMIGYEPIY